MERIIVQRGSAQKQSAEYCRSNTSTLSIGRAFDNDLFVSDPYVSEHQLKLVYEENTWVLWVLNDLNPVLVNGALVKEKVNIQSGDQLVIGHTRLSLFLESHKQEETRQLLFSAKWYKTDFSRNISLFAIVLIMLLTFLTSYNGSVTGLDLNILGTEGISVLATIFIWAGFFALLGKLVIHQANYRLQVMVTALVFVLSTIFDFVPALIEYQFSSTLVGEITKYLVSVCILTLLFKLNLYFSTHMMKSTLIAALISISLVGVSVFVENYENKDFKSTPEFSTVVKPPFIQLAPTVSLDEHFKEVGRNL